MERHSWTTGTTHSDFPAFPRDIGRPKSAEYMQVMAVSELIKGRENKFSFELNYLEEDKQHTALSLSNLLKPCIQICARAARRLLELEKLDTAGISGLMWPQSLWVLELRLHLWGQVATGSFEDSPMCYLHTGHPLQVLHKINGVLCEFDGVIVGLLQHDWDQAMPGFGMGPWNKASKLLQELINLTDVLHLKLPQIWRETTEWALIANLLVNCSLDVISDGFRGSTRGNLFPVAVALDLQVPRNLWSMFLLLDNRNEISPPMSYQSGLLMEKDLVCQGSFEGIRVYMQRSNHSSSEKSFISVGIVAWNPGETPEDAMNSQSIMDLQKRLQLPKPDEVRVLALAGYLENRQMGQVEIVYHTPDWATPGSPPISLSKLAAKKQLPSSIGTRLLIARKLACAVLHLHMSGWVHGNISDRNIIFFKAQGQKSEPNFLEPFFCNFAPVPKTGDDPEFNQQTDIYRLAWVILLLVLGEEVIGQLRGLQFEYHANEFEQLITRYGMLSVRNECVALLFQSAVMSCLSGQAAREGIIKQDDGFNQRSGFYWRVVRPLDQCLSLLITEEKRLVNEKAGLLYGSGFEPYTLTLPSNGADTQLGSEKIPEPSQQFETIAIYAMSVGSKPKAIEFEANTINSIRDQPFGKQNIIASELGAGLKEATRSKRGMGSPGKHSMVTAEKATISSLETIPNAQDIGTEDRPHDKIDEKERKQIYPVKADASEIKLWQEELLPRLEKILERHLPLTETASIDLLGIGTSREESRPTIVVTCQNTRQVKAHLRKRFSYDENIFDLKIRKGIVSRSSERVRRAREKRRARRSTGSLFNDCPNREYQPQPLSGASIGACLDGKPLPPGTYGGLILIDGKPYGMTVHHLLDPESDDEATLDEDQFVIPLSDDMGLGYEESPMGSTLEDMSQADTSPPNSDIDSMPTYWDDSESDDEGDYLDMSEPKESDSEDDFSAGDIGNEDEGDIGDIEGLKKNHGRDIVIMQPAQDDLPDQESPERGGSLETYKLGTILASSGIRRVTVDSEKHEIDWALIQISAQRLMERNIIRGGGKYLRTAGPSNLEPCAIVPMAELSELSVHATGRTSGLQGGVISPAMSSVRLHGRATFSRSWHVVGNLGIPGDSGSWVVDNDKGRVCGHILARCSTKRVSYIIPMELLLQDIKRTLNAGCVRLPTVATEVEQLLDEALLARLDIKGAGLDMPQDRTLQLCPPSAGY